MKILVIDNYDSFVYNLVYLLKQYKHIEVEVVKNDKINFQQVNSFQKILISPGPGLPQDAGDLEQLLKQYATTKDILGICLGHQSLGQFFGANLVQLKHPLHGVSSPINIIQEDYLLEGVQQKSPIAHYHSYVITDLPNTLQALAIDSHNNIMAFKHKQYDIRALQFHPESILTQDGKKIIDNWIKN